MLMVQNSALMDDNRAIQSSVWAIRIALFSAALVLLTILFHRVDGASTTSLGIAEIAARTWVHCRNQLEICGKQRLVGGPADHDLTRFQGLT